MGHPPVETVALKRSECKELLPGKAAFHYQEGGAKRACVQISAKEAKEGQEPRY